MPARWVRCRRLMRVQRSFISILQRVLFIQLQWSSCNLIIVSYDLDSGLHEENDGVEDESQESSHIHCNWYNAFHLALVFLLNQLLYLVLSYWVSCCCNNCLFCEQVVYLLPDFLTSIMKHRYHYYCWYPAPAIAYFCHRVDVLLLLLFVKFRDNSDYNGGYIVFLLIEHLIDCLRQRWIHVYYTKLHSHFLTNNPSMYTSAFIPIFTNF